MMMFAEPRDSPSLPTLRIISYTAELFYSKKLVNSIQWRERFDEFKKSKKKELLQGNKPLGGGIDVPDINSDACRNDRYCNPELMLLICFPFIYSL